MCSSHSRASAIQLTPAADRRAPVTMATCPRQPSKPDAGLSSLDGDPADRDVDGRYLSGPSALTPVPSGQSGRDL